MAQRQLAQVERLRDGTIREYAWRPESDGPGDPTDVQWTTTQVAPAGYRAWLMNLSAYGTSRSAGSGRWAVCPICLEEFPISEMALVKGRFYDYKNGCAQEVQSDA